MRLLLAALTVWCSFSCRPLLAQRLLGNSTGTIIAPPSGGVEIEEITIVRRKTLGAVKEADLTKMQVLLQPTAAWEGRPDHHLVRLHSLSPIKDDTGKLLTTQKRLKQIDYLQGEVRGQEWRNRADNKSGPSISLLLDAPQRSATKIMAIQGRAEVSRARAVELSFADLPAINGKDLSHPDMPQLKDLKLRFSVEVKDERVVTRVSAPFNYASPWNIGRLQTWTVWDKEKKEPAVGTMSKVPENGGVTVERTYRHASFDGWSLDIVVLEPVETKMFDFEFRDVELP